MLEIEAVLFFSRVLEVLSLLSFHCSIAMIGVVGCKFPLMASNETALTTKMRL
jgi:hypothetical protein